MFGLQWNLKNPARLRALFCFGGGGSKSNAIFTNLFKKNFVIILKVILVLLRINGLMVSFITVNLVQILDLLITLHFQFLMIIYIIGTHLIGRIFLKPKLIRIEMLFIYLSLCCIQSASMIAYLRSKTKESKLKIVFIMI